MPPFACSNQPLRRVDGAGERALLVAEQLRVDQLRRDGAAIHPAERTAAEGRVLVDRAGDDLLAGAGFAEQQHRRGAARHHVRPRHDRGQPGIAADQPFVAVGAIAGDQVLGQRFRGGGDGSGFL